MPDELWHGAELLAREHGAYGVACELGLNYQTLKRRTAGAPRAERRASDRGEVASGTFVEIDVEKMLVHGGGAATEVEVERGDGARLKIRLGAGQRLDVGAVTAAFVGGAR